MTNELNINTIMTYLPHRFPFLMVDKILEYEPGKSIHGIKNITVNEPCFTGHFPERPIMPGVLQIEALAQISGILSFLTTNTKPDPENWFFLAGADETRFKRIVMPGDQLHLHSTLKRRRMDVWLYSAEAKVDGELACSVQLMLAKGALK
ncbi:MAG: 3-hydroxyacyl-ACP dehydratase FabZ [Gammaproteobacteria bacterium]